MSRALGVLAAVLVGMSWVAVAPAWAGGGRPFPDELSLPDGFQPEGVAIGAEPVAYFGSLVDGDLYRVDLRTGRGEVFSQGPGTSAVGLEVDRRGRLFVAGGHGGDGRVVDARSGETLKTYRFATADTFVNDVVVTDTAAFFTDSFRPVLYRVPLERGGEPADTHTVIPLSGDFAHRPGGFNANGIVETPDRRALLVAQTATGQLHRVEHTGATRVVDLGGDVLTGADGLLVEGRTLYVVENSVNTVSVYRLDRAGTAGTARARITDPRFDVPTTVASFGHRLYLPNARFTTPPTATTPYNAVAVPKGRH